MILSTPNAVFAFGCFSICGGGGAIISSTPSLAFPRPSKWWVDAKYEIHVGSNMDLW